MLQCRRRTIFDTGFSLIFLQHSVVAHWINGWINVHDFWTAEPGLFVLGLFDIWDVQLFCFGNCRVNGGGKALPKYCLSLMCWMWLFQNDKFIVLEGSVNSASLTILVACSGFTGSPSHLMQPDTMKFPELWFLRIVPTDVAVIGAGGQNGN